MPKPVIGGSSSGCTNGSSYSLTTNTYVNGSASYCAEMYDISFGGPLNQLNAGSPCP